MGNTAVTGGGAHARRARGGFGVAGVAVVLAAVSGCGVDPATGGRFGSVAPDRIPAEVFWADKIALIEFADLTVTAQCMAHRGYLQLREAGIERPPAPFAHLDPAAALPATADAVLASESGFGVDEPARPATVAGADPAFDAALPKCRQSAADRIGPDWPDVRTQVHALVDAVAAQVATARQTAQVQDHRTTWTTPQLDCLDRRGHHQVHPGDRTLRSYAVGERQGTHTGPAPAEPAAEGPIRILPAVPARTYVPAPAESALAVAYAECAAETNLNTKLLAQELLLERAAITTHESTITDLTPLITTLAESAETLIAP